MVRANWVVISTEADIFVQFKKKLKKTKSALSCLNRSYFEDIFKQLDTMEDIVRTKEALFEEFFTGTNKTVLRNEILIKRNIKDRKQILIDLPKEIEKQDFCIIL